MTVAAHELASELLDAYTLRRLVPPPSSRGGGFDLAAAYEVEAAIVNRRAAEGHRPVGLKVGFANRAAWRILKIQTLVWAHMYDDTVRRAAHDRAELAVGGFVSPKIEPEIVLCVRHAPAEGADALEALEAVEWVALGFEIIDCVYPDWQFRPVDFVAAKGLHAGLIIGTPFAVTDDNRAALAAALPAFTVTLEKNGAPAATGSGKNALRSPALCLSELASALRRTPGAGELKAGDIISSGTLTESQALAAGETWTARVEGLDLTPLTVRTI